MDGSAIGLNIRRHIRYRDDAAMLPGLYYTFFFVEEIMLVKSVKVCVPTEGPVMVRELRVSTLRVGSGGRSRRRGGGCSPGSMNGRGE